MDPDEQQFTILYSWFCHWDYGYMTRVVNQRGEELREVVHAFQEIMANPAGQALVAFPTWEPDLATRLTKDLRYGIQDTVRLLLHLKYLENVRT